MHEKLANLSNFCFTLVVHLVSGRQARHIVSHGMQHVIWNTYDWRISPMVQPDKGPERESPNQRETPIALLDGAAGG